MSALSSSGLWISLQRAAFRSPVLDAIWRLATLNWLPSIAPAQMKGSVLAHSTGFGTIPTAFTRTSLSTRFGFASASWAATAPPSELPTATTRSSPRCSQRSSSAFAKPATDTRSIGISEPPKPGRSGAMTRRRSAIGPIVGSQTRHCAPSPCTSRTAGSPEPLSA